METQYKNCERDENCAGNDSGISPRPNFVKLKKCSLVKNNVILLVHEPGKPPSWFPALPGAEIHYVRANLFEKLKESRYKKPCHICPDEIKKKCEAYTE